MGYSEFEIVVFMFACGLRPDEEEWSSLTRFMVSLTAKGIIRFIVLVKEVSRLDSQSWEAFSTRSG